MSGDVFHLDARWRQRGESPRACAERLSAMLMALVPLHPAFAHWYRKGWSRPDANRSFCTMPPDIDDLARIFEKDPMYRGAPNPGYNASAWNGRDPPYGLSLKVKAGVDVRHKFFVNEASLSLNESGPANADLINTAVLKPALSALVAAWDPDCVKLQPWGYWKRWMRAEPWDDYDRKGQRRGDYVPRITSGWMVYLCADYARRITPPRGIDSETVIGGGLLMLATQEIFTAGNPAHDDAADAIQEALLPLQNLPRN
jgi:hypothetical protein